MRIPTKKLLTPELVSRFFVSVSENNEKAPKPVRLGAFQLFFVGLPRFELGQTEPKPVVLPLHHSPIITCFPWKAVQRYVFPAI